MTAPDATPPPMHSCTLDIAREGNARWDALRIADRYATDNAQLRDRVAELETDRTRLRKLLELRARPGRAATPHPRTADTTQPASRIPARTPCLT